MRSRRRAVIFALALVLASTIAAAQVALTVQTVGTGSVTSSPAGILCPTDCAETFAPGTVVTLTAVAGPGAAFSGWAGACAGASPCVIRMDDSRLAIAKFTTCALASGDINGNGIVTASDLVMLTAYLAGTITLDACQLHAADANCDGAVTDTDRQILTHYVNGEVSHLCA